MTEHDEHDEGKEQAKRELLEAIGKIAGERTTESGKACVEAAQKLVAMDELVEARHWVSLALSADKAKADVKLHKALEKLEQRGAKEGAFKKTRRGSKAG